MISIRHTFHTINEVFSRWMKSIAISLTSIWEQLLFFVISMILSTSCNCFSDEMPNFEILHQKTRSDITNTGIEIIIKTYGLNKCTSIWPIRCFFGSLHSFSKKKSPATHFDRIQVHFESNLTVFLIKLWIGSFATTLSSIIFFLIQVLWGKMCVQFVISFLFISFLVFYIFLHSVFSVAIPFPHFRDLG